MSSGGGTQKTTYQPPAEVMAAYKDLVSRGQSLLGGSAPQYTPQMAQQYAGYNAGLVAPMTPDQIQAMRSIAGTQGYMTPFINAGAGMASSAGSPLQLQQFSGQQIGQYMSPYLNNVVNAAVGNINETNARQQQQVLGNAIARGAFGGDRSGVAQAELARQQGLAGNATIANLLNSGYGQALGEFNVQQAKDLEAQALSRQYGMQGANILGQLGALGQKGALEQAQAQFGAGLAAQQQQQANLSTAYQQYMNQYQYPFNQLGWYGGLVSGAGSGMGGTTTQNMPGASPLASVVGIGSMLGAMGGTGGIPSLFSWMSDERVKENIEPVGETYDGQKIYRYNYKGEPRTQIGLIAQEVEKKHPDAVGDMGGGILGVNYHDATEKAADRGKFYSGGIVNGYKSGGTPTTSTTTTPTTSTWGYVAPNPAGDTVTPALNTYQNLASSGGGSYEDLQNSYADYLKSFQSPAGATLPMVGFAPKSNTPTTPPTDSKTSAKDRFYRGLIGHTGSSSTYGRRDPFDIVRNTNGTPTGGSWSSGNWPSGYGPDTPNNSTGESGTYGGGSDAAGVFANGGLVPQINMNYGLQSKEDVKNAAEQATGTGLAVDPATQALGSEDTMQSRASGGIVNNPSAQNKNYDEMIKDFLKRNEVAESGGKNAANPRSSAFGPQQITHATWNDLIKNPELSDLTPMDRLKPEAQRRAAPYIAKNIINAYQKHGVAVTPETLRMGWFLGPQGGAHFMKNMVSNPDAPAAHFVSPNQVASNRELFEGKDGQLTTAHQLFNTMASQLGKPEKKQQTTLLDQLLKNQGQGVIAKASGGSIHAATGTRTTSSDVVDDSTGVIPSDNDPYMTLHPAFRDSARKFIQDANAAGYKISPGSMTRSPQEQENLYKNRSSNPYPVAPPGSSGHEYSLAMDLSGYKPEYREGLAKLAKERGLTYGGDFNDPVHVQFGPNRYAELKNAPRDKNGFVILPEGWASGATGVSAKSDVPATGASEAKGASQASGSQKGFFENLFPGLDEPGRLALFKFGATLAGTPGPFGYGLAAAANAYADSMIGSKRLSTESAKRAAETEREEATAGLTRAQETQQRFMKTPTGQFILSRPGDEPIGVERFNPSQVSQTGTYGGQPSGAPSSPPVVTDSGTPVTPQAPTAPGTPPRQQPSFGSIYEGGASPQDKQRIYDQAVNDARNNDMAYGTYGEKMQEQFRDAQTAYQQKQAAAADAAQDLTATIRAVSSLSDDGWLRPGADAEFRYAVGKYADTYLGVLGASSGLNPEISANEILGKLSTFQANAQAKGNPAARWQETLKESMPNVDQQPSTTRSLVSSLIVNNRRDQDLGEFAARYGKDTYYVGTDLNNVFNRLHSQQEYANDKTAIETLLAMGRDTDDKGVRINPITDLIAGRITSKQFDEFVYNYMKERNPRYTVTNLSRYFARPTNE